MKKLVTLLFAAMLLLTTMTAIAEEENNMNWAYGEDATEQWKCRNDLLHRRLLWT